MPERVVTGLVEQLRPGHGLDATKRWLCELGHGGVRATGGNLEPYLVGLAGARHLRVHGGREARDVADNRIAARAGEVVDDGGDPHRHPPSADLERERPSDAAHERREPRRHEHGGRSRVGRLPGADSRVVLLVDPVGELDAVSVRTQHDATLAEPRLRREAAEPEGAGQRAACVGSPVDEPRRHELERDELAAAQSRRQRAVEVRRGIFRERAELHERVPPVGRGDRCPERDDA